MFDATFNLNVNTDVNSKELQKLIDSLGVLRAEIHRLNKMSLANVQRSAEGLVSTGKSLIDALKVQTAANGDEKALGRINKDLRAAEE